MVNLPGRSRGNELPTSINVTPMIDVMLVLLIIFMVVAAAAPFTATLPPARAALPAAEDRVTLGIDRAGTYWLGRTPVVPALLPARLEAEYARRPGDHVLYLKADQGVRYTLVLDALDEARQAGVRRLAVITAPGD